MIESVLKLNTHCVLTTNPWLFKYTSDPSYFLKDSEIIHAALESLNNQ